MAEVSTGMLSGEIPYLALGEGPPLVQVQGLTPTHEVPTGMERRMALSMVKPWAGHFRVHLVNRKRAVAPGESMSDIAGHLATAIDAEFGGPVFLTGTSTGGSVVRSWRWTGLSWCGRWWWCARPTGSARRAGRCSRTWPG